MNSVNEGLHKEVKELLERFPQDWKGTSSDSCFIFLQKKLKLYICDYYDADNVKNINITTLDNDGNTISDIIISSVSHTLDYNLFRELHSRIKDQVYANNMNAIQEKISKILAA